MRNILDIFNISDEQETYEQITETITKSVTFSGANLSVLVFAIVVASVGLNVNSTAVIIGAMLISPLMGPIMGVGLGLGTYDLGLIKLSIKNLLFAVVVSLFASTLYFMISPLNQAHSELFARTSPNIYDVLIAFFGGLAGITAITSKQKGNALQGAAIATALMPPLCTAGFGIATAQWDFFFGAFYLFIINSVFISLATYTIVRFIKFPAVGSTDKKFQLLLKRIVFFVVFLTLIPSIYLGYQLTQQERFSLKANQFIDREFIFEDSYLLNKKIDFSTKSIHLIAGGNEIDTAAQANLKKRLALYGLQNVTLLIKNTLSFKFQYEQVREEGKDKLAYVSNELMIKQKENSMLKHKLDSLEKAKALDLQISKEIKTQYPAASDVYMKRNIQKDSLSYQIFIINAPTNLPMNSKEIDKLKKWLVVRLNNAAINIYAIAKE
ncbi:MAG: DUF389 domain-containing protein [Flavobacterium sp.]|nr:MAG: DUF389 domain-containing protein [Flavobacterium sp.]